MMQTTENVTIDHFSLIVNTKPNTARITKNSRSFWGTIRTLENVLEEPNTIFLKSDEYNVHVILHDQKFYATFDWTILFCFQVSYILDNVELGVNSLGASVYLLVSKKIVDDPIFQGGVVEIKKTSENVTVG